MATFCYLFKKSFICLFILAGLGLHCYEGFSLVAASGGYSLVAVHGLPITVISLVTEHRLRARALIVAACGLTSCSSQARDRLNSCDAQA